MTAPEEIGRSRKGICGLWQRTGLRIVMGLLAFTVVALFSFPFGAKIYLQKWLLENGADVARIDRVRLNPFNGVVALEGVTVEKEGNTLFSDSVISLNVGLTKLLGHEIRLQQVFLSDLHLDIEILEDGTSRIASYTIAPQQTKTSAPPDNDPPQVEEDPSWIFRADNITIQNLDVRLKHPDLTAELVIEEAKLKDINTDPNGSEGSLFLTGSVNGAPIFLDLQTVVLVPGIDVEGKIAVSGFRLNNLTGILGEYLDPFSGTAGLDGTVAFTMAENLDLHAAYDGIIDLDQGDIGGVDGWRTQGIVHNEGKVSFTMTMENLDMVVDVDGDLRAREVAFDLLDPRIDIDNADILISGKTVVTIGEEVVVDSAASLQLAPTTFAMDFLKTSVGITSWQGVVQVETGTKTKELTVLADGRLDAAEPSYSMELDDFSMEIDNQMISWDGKVEYLMGLGPDDKSLVHSDGTLLSGAMTVSMPELIQLALKKIDYSGKTEVAFGSDVAVSYQGDLLVADTDMEMEGVRLGDSQLTWSGKIGYSLGEEEQTISLEGTLNNKELFMDGFDVLLNQKNLTTVADCSLTLAESPGFQGTFSVDGKGLELSKEKTVLASLAEFSTTKARGNGSGGLLIESFALQELLLPATEVVPVSVSVPSLRAEHLQSLDLAGAEIGRVTIEHPLVTDADSETQLAVLQNITADTIQLTKDMELSVQEVTAGGGVFLKEKEKDAMATLAGLRVDQVSYSPDSGFACNRVELDGLHGEILKKKSAADDEEEKKEKTEKTALTLPVKINQIRVTGKSGFQFTDESLSKTFMTLFAIQSLRIDDIDLNNAENFFSYNLQGSFDKYSPLHVEGKCAPLAADIMLEQKATLNNLSMLQVSPYGIEAIGTFFPSGFLDYNSDLKISDGRINMTNHLIFSDLEAEAVNAELADKLNNQLPISLDLVLNILREQDDRIDLQVPIEGELSHLSVGLSDIIVTALGKGITVAVTPYLAYTALGPAGILAYVGVKAGRKLFHSELPVLEFEHGALELTEAQREVLAEVGEEMEDDEEAKYLICAKVRLDELSKVKGDSEANQDALRNEAIRRELFTLGEKRSLLVQEYLLSNYKIDKQRLSLCDPGIEFGEEEKATVGFKEVYSE